MLRKLTDFIYFINTFHVTSKSDRTPTTRQLQALPSYAALFVHTASYLCLKTMRSDSSDVVCRRPPHGVGTPSFCRYTRSVITSLSVYLVSELLYIPKRRFSYGRLGRRDCYHIVEFTTVTRRRITLSTKIRILLGVLPN